MKILFTTPVLEYPAAGGPQLRILNSIKALNMVSELHVVSRVSFQALGGVSAQKHFEGICHRFVCSASVQSDFFERIINYRMDKSFPLNKYLNIPFKILSRIYRLLIKKTSNKIIEDARFIRGYTVKNGIDIIWFGYGNISYDLMKTLKEYLPDVKMVCDTDSVWSRYVLRELEIETDPVRIEEIKANGRKKEIEEQNWVDFMDVTTAVSEVDAEYYRSIASDASRIKVFSNVIDLDMYKNNFETPTGLKKPYIYLAGSFWKNSPMENAARWMITEVFPIVKQQISDVHLCILGKGSDTVLSDVEQESIYITGKVASVLPYLCNSDVAVVPLKWESGTRFKILEAGVCKIPIVSTTLGAEGIPARHEKEILIADSAEEFAGAVVRLINDRIFAEEIAGSCKKLIEEKYSVKYLSKEAESIIQYLFKRDF